MESAWSELFLLSAFQWNLGSENCPLLEISKKNNLEFDTTNVKNPSENLHIDLLNPIKELYNLFNKYSLDQGELACLKAIVLFRSGKHKKNCNLIF